MTIVVDEIALEKDLELFGVPVDARTRWHQPGRDHWELGFGPVGGHHPVWGLYRFENDRRAARERELLWRLCPTQLELLRWCSRYVGGGTAATLIAEVGAFDAFYQSYFAIRPEYGRDVEKVRAARGTLIINGSPGSGWRPSRE